jgi:hypothetical protein
MGPALDRLHQRLQERESVNNVRTTNGVSSGLPTRLYVHHGANNQFQRTTHAYRV